MRFSVAFAADESGKVVGAAKLPHGIALHTMPRDILQSRLKRLIQEVARSAGRDLNRLTDATVCIGLTGVTFPYDADVDLPREFADLRIPVRKLICTGDIEVAFAAAAKESVGSAVLCHMGSAAIAMTGPHRPQRFRVGGWGPALGDEGSGYWIGRSALRVVGQQYDRRSTDTSPLWNRIVEWLSDPRPDVQTWSAASCVWNRVFSECSARAVEEAKSSVFSFAHEVSRESHSDWRDVVSGLVVPVMKAAFEDHDPEAQAIVREAASHLISQLQLARRVSGLPSESPLIFTGGVLMHNSQFRELLGKMLRDDGHEPPEIVTERSPGALRPAFGALLFALADGSSSTLALPEPQIHEHLVDQSKAVDASVGLGGQ